MQFFERSSVVVPRFFRSSQASRARDRLLDFFSMSPLERSQTRLSDSALELKHRSVFDGLSELFRGKCAFCETQGSTLPYRFRPQASATPEGDNGHLYYTWLANAWENIYPICRDCIPRLPEFFPVEHKRAPLPTLAQLTRYRDEGLGLWGHPIREVALLLEPCRNEFFYKHFFVSVSGVFFEKTPRGGMTIEHFNLNRKELVSDRESFLRNYRRELIAQGVVGGLSSGIDNRGLFDFSSLEFGGSWYLQCRMIVDHLSKAFGKKMSLTASHIGNSFSILCRNKRFNGYEQQLIDWIETQDFGRLNGQGMPWPAERDLISVVKQSMVNLTPVTYPSLLSIELTHFKAIDYLKLRLVQQPLESIVGGDPVQPAMLILGENATGKSSILEATALALSDLKTRRLVAPNLGELVLDPSYLGAPNSPPMPYAQIRLGFDDGIYSVIETDGAAWKPEVALSHPPVFAYGAFRQYQQHSAAYKPGTGISNLFDSSRLLPDPEAWLLGLGDKKDFDAVARVLRIIMAVDGDLDVIEKSKDRSRCLIVTRPGGVKTVTPLSHVSSGYRSVLAMVCDIMRRLMDRSANLHYQSLENSRAIVLIDEVEAHLHPRWKIQIMGALRKALPKVTFIATSHDPLCVRGMHHGEVVVVRRTAKAVIDGDATQIAQVEQLLDLPDISQLTIEQLLTSDFFSLASTDQPLMNQKLAQLADLLSASYTDGQLDSDEQQVVQLFKEQINDVLPVGTTQGQRLVQEVVAEFLQKRISASRAQLQAFDEDAKSKILAVLEGF